MITLTEQEVEYLKSKGFKQEDKKHSGFFYLEDVERPQTLVLIPKEDGFKLEFIEICDDGEGGCYDDLDKEYSKPDQDLKSFIEDWI